ncbi:MAG: class I SAM-dependent methyltransferase [Gemmataceae bacterium]|nr:class I SAM-dependent methyltransferase [Gemmataceae bacterium]
MPPPHPAPLLAIPEGEIRRHGPGNLLAVCWRQWRGERTLAARGVHFRAVDAAAVAGAYAAMSDREFDAINGRQDWANWRTIPRCLSGRLPDRPLTALDLGCGTGSSTRVLAFYCPLGSEIVGYELVPALAAVARRRAYLHRSGSPARVAFVCQGVTEPLRRPDGSLVPDKGADLVNASGVVGHHLDEHTVQPLVAELRRILAPGGIAMLDVGPTLRAGPLTRILTAAGFHRLGHWRSWWLDPTGQVVFRATRLRNAECGMRNAD